MDISKLSRGQLIAGAGGALLIVSLFLSWVSLIGASASAFDAFSGMDIIMLVIGIAAVAFAGVTATEASVEVPANAAVVVGILGVLIVGWALGWVLEQPSAGFGAWLGLISAGAIAYGGWEADRKPTPMALPTTARHAPTAREPTTAQQPAAPPQPTRKRPPIGPPPAPREPSAADDTRVQPPADSSEPDGE